MSASWYLYINNRSAKVKVRRHRSSRKTIMTEGWRNEAFGCMDDVGTCKLKFIITLHITLIRRKVKFLYGWYSIKYVIRSSHYRRCLRIFLWGYDVGPYCRNHESIRQGFHVETCLLVNLLSVLCYGGIKDRCSGEAQYWGKF